MISIGIIDKDTYFLSSLSNYLKRFVNFNVECQYHDLNECKKEPKTLEKLDILLLDQKTIRLSDIKHLNQYTTAKQIFLTDEVHPRELISVIKHGASGYILKTGNFYEIFNAISIVHTGGCALGPQIAKIIVDSIKNESHPEWQVLTKREQEFAREVFKGLTYKEIANEQCVSLSTVSFHLQNIYLKLNVKSRAELVSKYSMMECWRH
ncbi:response regulator transcription factor [Pedobacter sp. BS3]|uniref:response regulator transcription factor n=1 Tax=Pedobacter sp. BS3 TaxID=2567937 RepID=UPI0011EE11D1|nr:response regulator transcription factor [Pedobacter sp. BS3]TZF81539.1 response regulator transcription factor [Pedobacter sp. BS3]